MPKLSIGTSGIDCTYEEEFENIDNNLYYLHLTAIVSLDSGSFDALKKEIYISDNKKIRQSETVSLKYE